MALPRVIKSGTYTNGGPSLQSAWVEGTAAINGVVGTSPMQFLGWFDLRPWQGTPEGAGRNMYDRNVIALDSGEGRVRFSLPWDGTQTNGGALNPVAQRTAPPMADIIYGSRSTTQTAIWQPEDEANRFTTPQAVSLMVAAVDGAENIMDWATSVPQQWGDMDAANTDPNPRNLFQNAWSIGPELISELSHGGASSFDLGELGGGARFVGLWMAGYWLGPGIDATQVGARIKWEVEDRRAPKRKGPITFAYPIRAVQQEVAAGAIQADPLYTVAQWSLQRFGGIDLVGATGGGSGGFGLNISGPGCSVIYCNGGLQVEARIDYHVGTAVDQMASSSAFTQTCGGASPLGPIMTRLNYMNDRLAQVQPPYSYASLISYTTLVQGTAPDGYSNPAIIFVCVG